MGKRDYGLSLGLVVLGKSMHLRKTSNREVGHVNLEHCRGAWHKSSVWNGLHTIRGRGIILAIITLEEIAGELTLLCVPGKASLRDIWQASQVYPFRHKLQRLGPLPPVSCRSLWILSMVSQELRYAQMSPVRARLCKTDSSGLCSFLLLSRAHQPHPQHHRRSLVIPGSEVGNHKRKLGCFWINSSAVIVVLTW